jgi:subtilisin family serine protease
MAGITPNDHRYNQQWGLDAIQAPNAWEISTGSTGVPIAVIDFGVDYTHPDLYQNIWLNQAEIPQQVAHNLVDFDGDRLITFWDLNNAQNQGPGKISDLNGNGYIDGGDVLRPESEGGWANEVDDGHNGYEDDLVGWDFFGDDNDPIDVHGHGTAIAGVIGAVGNNGEGVAGLNWRSQIMAVQFQPPHGGTTPAEDLKATRAIPLAIRYAVDNGARVSNNSWGARANEVPPDLGQPIVAAIEYAEARGHLMVFSAGNDGFDNDTSPAADVPSSLPHENIISVAATSQPDRLSNYSNFGENTVDLAAPGDHIWSTDVVSQPGQPYTQRNGTSLAAPHVVGTAALILALNPNLSYTDVKEIIIATADPLPDLTGKMVSNGRLNAFDAVSAATLTLSANGSESVTDSESISTAVVVPPPAASHLQAEQHRTAETSFEIHDASRLRDDARRTIGQSAPAWIIDTGRARNRAYYASAIRLAADAHFAQLAADDQPQRPGSAVFRRGLLRGLSMRR